MKFSMTLLALGATALAKDTPTRVTITKRTVDSLQARDIATINGVLGSVSASLSALNAAATGFSGAASLPSLQSAGTALNDALTSGASTVQGTDAVSTNDAITLQATSANLQNVAQSLTDSLAAKKPDIEAAGACAAVREQASSITTNSQALIDAVVSKVPTELQTVAQGIVSGFTNVLQQNSANFAEGNCTDSAGGAGGATSSSASSSAEATTSSATSAATSPATSSAAATTAATGRNTASARPTATTNATSPGGAAPSTPVVVAGAGALAAPIGMGLVFAALLL